MRASIDIGSNSLLLLVVDDAGKVVHDEQRVVGLGKGLGDRGVFRSDRMEAAGAVLADYARIAASHGVAPEAVRAVATSAARRALNAPTFFANQQKKTGLKIQIISGDDEARLTWQGGASGIELSPGPVLLCDLGGGSTEIIVGEGRDIYTRVSLEIGTVRLTDAFLGYGQVDPASLSRMRAHVDSVVSALKLPVLPRSAVAVAGTATTFAALELGLTTYDGGRVHGSTLSVGALRTWMDKLLEAGPEARKALVGVSPDRADTLLAGAVILLRVLETTRRQAWKVSDRGLRWALVQG
jgi:exopolyphosphatase/guanosine-5'-triphosphate,3'-diphosphate pyrophosphatase